MRTSVDSSHVFVKRKLPLSAPTTAQLSPSKSTLPTAVLPRRKRKAFTDDRPQKRSCTHGVAKHEQVEIIFDARNRGKFSKTSEDGIDSEKIFQQLNVLKRGSYWKHLLRSDLQEEDDGQDEDYFEYGEARNYSRRKENKENTSHTGHPNTRSSDSTHEATSYNEEEDSRNEEESHSGRGQFVGSVISSNNKGDTMGISFRVYAITEEGWMCGLEPKEQSTILLHLPPKVAALGRQGMVVTGVDLMKRKDNGVLEPYSHFRSSNSSANYLFGSVSYGSSL